MNNPTTTATSSKRKATPGSFRPGPDPRRHRFTREECSKGFWTAIAVWGVGIGQKLNASGRWPGYQRRRPAR